MRAGPLRRRERPLLYSPAPGIAPTPASPRRSQPSTRRMPHAVTPELDHAWAQIQEALRDRVGERTYGLWLAPLRCVGARRRHARARRARPRSRRGRWTRLCGALADAVAGVLGPAVAVDDCRQLAAQPAAAPRRAPARPGAAAPEPQVHLRAVRDRAVEPPRPRRRARRSPRCRPRPTTRFSSTALRASGKTHLLHSVGNYVTAFGGGLTVRYATAEEFTNAFLAALHARSLDEFKRASAASTCC